MTTTCFDVNDAGLRESFLRDGLLNAIDALADTSTPRWGRMRAQEMVEHLAWAFRLSTGRQHVDCTVPLADRERFKQGLYSNRPTPREVTNPALARGLPPRQFDSLVEAKAALAVELGHFLDGPGLSQQLYTHPFFGPIGHADWHRTHYKHALHHLLQFGLIELESEAPPGGPAGTRHPD